MDRPRLDARVADEIQRLADLRASGALSEEEFAAIKRRLLEAPPAAPANRIDERDRSENAGTPVEIRRLGIGFRIFVAFFMSGLSLWLLLIPFVGWILCPVIILWSIAHVFGLQADTLVGVCPSCGSKITFDRFNASADDQVGEKPGRNCSACKKRIILDADRNLLVLVN